MITGIGHCAYSVADVEASLEFYCGKLGLKEAFRLHNDQGKLWIVYVLVGNGAFVELFPGGEPPNPPTLGGPARPRPPTLGGPAPPRPPTLGGKGGQPGSYRHLCLQVDDMDATLKELAARGLPIDGQANRGKDGNVQYWLTDPDGNRIELMEIAPDSLQAQALR